MDWAELDDEETGDKHKDSLKKFELVLVVNLKETSNAKASEMSYVAVIFSQMKRQP